MRQLTRGKIADFFNLPGNHKLSFVVTYGDKDYPKIGMRHASYGRPHPIEGHFPFVAIVDPRRPPDSAVLRTVDQLDEGWPVDALNLVARTLLRVQDDQTTDSIKAALLEVLPENSSVEINVHGDV